MPHRRRRLQTGARTRPSVAAHAQIGSDDSEHERDERAEIEAMRHGTEIACRGRDDQQREGPAPANIGCEQQRKERERPNLNRQRPERVVLEVILDEKYLRDDRCHRRKRARMAERRQAVAARSERNEDDQGERGIICRQNTSVALHREIAKIE